MLEKAIIGVFKTVFIKLLKRRLSVNTTVSVFSVILFLLIQFFVAVPFIFPALENHISVVPLNSLSKCIDNA